MFLEMHTLFRLLPATLFPGLALIAALALGGCASSAGIHHDQAMHKPQTPVQPAAFAAWPQRDWWKAYQDDELDRLITAALQDNPNIVLAAKRMQKAQAYVGTARSASQPQVNGSASVIRQRLSENAFYPPPYGGSYQTLADAALNASYDLDFWGKNDSALQAALSQVAAEKAQQSAARLMVSTAVARTYFQLAAQLEQQKLAQLTLAQREQELKLIRDRIATGLDTKVELNQGQSAIAAARVELETAAEAIALTRNALAALTAQEPAAIQSVTPLLPAATIQALPQDVPVDFIGRRPDLAAARARVDAATADIAVAKAEFYPNISLSAFIGLSSFGLSKFLQLGSTVVGAGPALHLPIFDGGRLRANLQSKNADLDIAIASYNQALLEAFHDVADQITSLSSINKEFSDQQSALEAAESAYHLAKVRYQAGLSNYLSVLSAEDSVVRERSRTLNLRARRLDTDIALIKSLGGGFTAPGTQNLSQR